MPPNGEEKGSSSMLLSVEEIVQYPLPGYAAPSSVCFSPDDSLVSFLFSPEGSLHKKVFVFDPVAGTQRLLFAPPEGGGLAESNLSGEEKLRRERARERGLGVTRYEWRLRGPSLRDAQIMVPLPSGIYFQDISSCGQELKLYKTTQTSPIIDPHLSPDGIKLAFVRDGAFCVLNLFTGELKKFTLGAEERNKTLGLAEYIAQEEMDRKSGFWWSLDSEYIAFTEVDYSGIPLYRIMHLGSKSVGMDAQEDHAYPFAGASNVKVRLGVVPSSGGEVTWMDLHCGKDKNTGDEEYLARVNWMPDNSLIAQVLNRGHSKLMLLKFDISTGKRQVVLVEDQNIWINLHDCFTPLEKGSNKFTGGFIWASERTGFRHLYLHDKTGASLGPLTEGEWMVEQVAAVNESAGLIYFTGTMDSPLETNLYCTNLFPDWSHSLPTPKRLTLGKGRHTVTIDHQMQCFVDIHDSLDTPPKVLLCSLQNGYILQTIYEHPISNLRHKNELLPPEIIEIPARDGTILYGALYKPDAERFGPPPYKTMINVYGGPSVQLVSNSWVNTVDMRAQYLRNNGILVWKLDNRGSSRRGLKFEGHLKHNMGGVDADDQHTGVEWLVRNGLAKPGHIGLYGWSYGGYLSAMSLSRFPDVFCCAVAGAPVTSWDGYDTFYTEKYMGLPSENHEAYEHSSIMHHVYNLKGKLLLVHGMIDENVHFRHTTRLVNELVGAGKSYELLVFPDERHMPRRLKDRMYMEARIWEFIGRNL